MMTVKMRYTKDRNATKDGSHRKQSLLNWGNLYSIYTRITVYTQTQHVSRESVMKSETKAHIHFGVHSEA